MTSLLLIATLLTGPATTSPDEAEYYLKAGRVHLGTGEVLEGATIHVKDGKIVAVAKTLPIPSGAKVLDCSDCEVMPGMVEGVSSAGLANGRSENEEGREHTPSLRISAVLDATQPALGRKRAAGVTSLIVHPGARNVIGGLACHIKPVGRTAADLLAQDAVALRITLGTDPAAGHRGGRGFMNRRPQSRMATVFEVRNEFQRARVYGQRRKADPKTPVHPDYEVLLAAMAGKVTVHWQARREKDIQAALRLAREFGVRRNVVIEAFEADECGFALAAAKVPALIGPLFHPQYGGGPRAPMNPFLHGVVGEGHDHTGHDHAGHAHDHSHDHTVELPKICLVGCEEDHEHVHCGDETHVHDETWPTCFGHDCCAVGVDAAPPPEKVHRPVGAAWRLWQAGVPCGFARGGDEPGATLLDFARFAVRAGLPADRAMRMLTIEPARICGIAERVGSIARGKDADLVVMSGDPLAPTSAVRMVIIDGAVVSDARKEKTK